MLKTNADLRKLMEIDPNSTDIYKQSPIDRYSNRPDELEDICLADFIAKFNFVSRGRPANDDDDDENLNDIEVEPVEEDDSRKAKRYELKNNSGFISTRRQPKVIRYCRFNIHQDEHNFFREMCLLFYPWRSELQDIEEADCTKIYQDNEESIMQNYRRYNAVDMDIREVLREIEQDRRNEEELEAADGVDRNPEENTDYDNVYEYDDTIVQADAAFEMGMDAITVDKASKYTVPDMIRDDEFLKLCDSLNDRQRDYLMHLISRIKNDEGPIYDFISGGAGVGKSVLIRAMYQAIVRIYRSEPGPVDTNEVLLIAYTGMAAHNIGGMTAHGAFHLAANRGNTSAGLNPDTCNTISARLRNLKVIIIDEISMLSSELFNQISAHCKQIFNSTQEFGGRSVIVVGDLFQLQPVGGHWIFQAKDAGRQNSTSILTENPQWKPFKLFKLIDVMRQRDDLEFATALSRVANGTNTVEDVNMFNSRCFTEESLPQEAHHFIRLMPYNKQVDAYNLTRARTIALTSPMTITYLAVDKFIGHVSERQKRQATNEIEKLNKKDTQNLITSLELVVGLRYMISTNIDVSDGIFNGASGILRFIEVLHRRVQAVYIEFDDKKIGSIARSRRSGIMMANNLDNSWTPILQTRKTFNVLRNGSIQVSLKFINEMQMFIFIYL